jgi:hypothetical protein
MSIPKTFIPFLTQFSDFSRKKIRVNTVGKDTATANEITQILLPEGKLDLTTFSLGGLLTTTTTSGTLRAPPIEQLIEQVMIEVGSVQLHPSMTFYGHIWGMFSDLQGSWVKRNTRAILNLQPVDSTVANQTAVPFQCNSWLGFLNDIQVLNTDRLPPVRIYIRWAPLSVCSSGTAVGGKYELSGLYSTVDMMSLSPVYDELMTSKIAQSPLQIPYTNYQVVPGNVGGLTQVTRFSSTSDSLQKLYAWFISSDYQTLGGADADTFTSAIFNRGATGMHTANFASKFTVNGSSFPDTPAQLARGENLLNLLQVINEDHDITSQPHPNLTTLARYATKFFADAVSFTYDEDGPDAALHRKCGLSALGNNLVGSYESTGTGGSSLMPLVVLETKAVLEVGPSKAVRVIY